MYKKSLYRLYTTGTEPSGTPLEYSYSSTKNIKMTVDENGFFIETERKRRQDAFIIDNDRLLLDAVRKACIIQLIRYGRIAVDTLVLSIDGEEAVIYDAREKQEPLIYGLCGNVLQRKMSTDWGETQEKRILKTTKSGTNRLDASLYALLVAKSKTYETERFIYLWMAFNGLYGYIAEMAEDSCKVKGVKSWIKKEYAQLKFISMLFEFPYRRVDKDRENSFRFKMELEITKIRPEEVRDFLSALKNNGKNEHVTAIENILCEFDIKEKMSAYAAISIYFPYLVRCKYFHGERALPLLCFENEHPLPVLRVLNVFIEDFLDKNLYQWFDEERLENDFHPNIKTLIEACKVKDDRWLKSCVVNGKELA